VDADPDRRGPHERTRASDRGLRRLIRENWYRDLWLMIITILVLVTLQGFAPLGIKGVDDIAREGTTTAQKARDAADQATKLAKQNTDLIAENKITKAEIRRIAREQARPSVQQVLKLIAKATQICTQNPAACRHLAGSGSRTSSGTSTSRKPTTHRTGSRSPPWTRKEGRKRPPSSGGGGSAPPPSSPPEHPHPPAVVQVNPPAPLPRPVCADDLVRIGDCP
jgi:hypothetical protein